MELCAFVSAHMYAYADDQGQPLLLTSQKSNGSEKKWIGAFRAVLVLSA